MIRYIDSIIISRIIFDMVMQKIANREEDGYVIKGSLNTFNNCREQGYYANIYGNEKNGYKDLYIWVHEQRNSDEIVVRWQETYPEDKGMFSEDTHKNRTKYFHYNEEHRVADYIMQLIMEHLMYYNEKFD